MKQRSQDSRTVRSGPKPKRHLSDARLQDILSAHDLWVTSGGGRGRRADLSGTDLSRADLRGTNLEQSELWDADLQGAFLRGANLAGADLSGANLQGTGLFEVNLEGAVLSRADLQDAVLFDAVLRSADCRQANLRDARLHGADLRQAVLVEANLHGAHFKDVRLKDADLKGADLIGAQSLTCEQLWETRNWESAYRGDMLACGGRIPKPPESSRIAAVVSPDGEPVPRYRRLAGEAPAAPARRNVAALLGTAAALLTVVAIWFVVGTAEPPRQKLAAPETRQTPAAASQAEASAGAAASQAQAERGGDAAAASATESAAAAAAEAASTAAAKAPEATEPARAAAATPSPAELAAAARRAEAERQAAAARRAEAERQAAAAKRAAELAAQREAQAAAAEAARKAEEARTLRAENMVLLGIFRDWQAFADIAAPRKFCVIKSRPTETRDRSEPATIFAFVAHRPKAQIRDQVGMAGGAGYRDGSAVRIEIDDQVFELYTEGDSAYTNGVAARDRERGIVTAMKRGQYMTVRGQAGNGAAIEDKYSLMGFTAAYTQMSKACGIE